MVIAGCVNGFLPVVQEIRRSMIRMEATVVGIFLIAIAAALYWFRQTNGTAMILGILAVVAFSSLELFFLVRLWRMRHVFR